MRNDTIAALGIPDAARVDQRVPKRLVMENGAPTASDKKRIQEGVEEIVWLAALKPTTIGIPEYRDPIREYLEIAVLRMTLHPKAKTTRIVELLHRAIPYPVLLITLQDAATSISAAHKRWSEGEAGKTVLDGELFTATLDFPAPGLWPDVLAALALGRQPRTSLRTVYQGWIDLLIACNSARITGSLVLPASGAAAADRHAALCRYEQLKTEATRLRALAGRETQISRQVERNLELKRLEAEMTGLSARLSLSVQEESEK